MALLIDGKALAKQINAQSKEQTQKFIDIYGIQPRLIVIIIGDDVASQTYVASKKKLAEKIGMSSDIIALPSDISQKDILAHIEKLNRDDEVHGILVQMPLPPHLDPNVLICAINPKKDVDGLHPDNAGRLALGMKGLYPCTPSACVLLAKYSQLDLNGLHVVIIGRSILVGRPLASLMLRENCTVTITHSRTKNIEAICRAADMIIAAAGKPHLVKASWVQPSTTIIDVGIHRQMINGKSQLIGDVAFDEVFAKARAITPVPGGVGPMTVACLMKNNLKAALWQKTNQL